MLAYGLQRHQDPTGTPETTSPASHPATDPDQTNQQIFHTHGGGEAPGAAGEKISVSGPSGSRTLSFGHQVWLAALPRERFTENGRPLPCCQFYRLSRLARRSLGKNVLAWLPVEEMPSRDKRWRTTWAS